MCGGQDIFRVRKVHSGGDDDDDEGNSVLARKDGQMEMYCRRSRRFAPSTSARQLFWLTSSCWTEQQEQS